MAYEWLSKEFDETGEFWFISKLRELLLDHGILSSEQMIKGMKIEWNHGSPIEVKYKVLIEE